ncbi:unnamed protein product, partial [Durusdinium trenchii]
WHAFLCLLCNRLPQYADSKTDSPCALREKDDNGGFKFVSNAFQIDPAPSNIDYLKKAIKTENAATVQCDAFQIEIFSQQEEPWCQQEGGDWSKEDEEASIKRGVSKLDCYGYLIP